MKCTSHKGFTLIELLIVIAIMGLMGTLSASGYRSMRRGMEQRSILRNASQFIRNAYQRAQIDRQPTAVFFWNEVRQDETDDGDSLVVVGRAVAVRASGRISAVSGNVLVDEFGDLESFKVYKNNGGTLEEDEDAADNGVDTYIYRMTGSGSWDDCKYPVAQAPKKVPGQTMQPFLLGGKDDLTVDLYGYNLTERSGGWTAGTTYGFEFAELTLPNNYIFGSDLNVTKIDDGPTDVGKALWFYPEGDSAGGSGGTTIAISAIRPGKNGNLEAQPFPDETENPKED